VPVKADGAVVPGGRRHVVKPGETGLAIAAAYKVSWRRIATANGIGFDSVIRVGQPLFIPDDAVAASTLPPARKPARAPAGSAGTAPSRPSAQPAAAPDPEAMARAFSLNIDDLVSGSAVAAPAKAPSARTATPGSPVTAPAPVPVTAVPRLAWPVDGRVILSGFGPKPGGKVNEGVTIKAQKGAAVRAAAPGTVLYVGDAIPSFGLLVLVRHDNGVITAYGHLEDALVDKGQALDRGAILGRAGTSGQASEPSLMFQLRLGRKPVDPMPFLRAQA
jgi:murein DD-endopeptidase MepM/ murein hydrolase activator NlpD